MQGSSLAQVNDWPNDSRGRCPSFRTMIEPPGVLQNRLISLGYLQYLD